MPNPNPHIAIGGSITPTGDVSARIKASLSASHLLSAAYFARRCEAVERSKPDPIPESTRREHRAYAIGAVLSAAAFLEAGINELYLQAVDRNPHVFGAADAQLPTIMAQVWPELEERRSPVLYKFQRALTLAGKEAFEEGLEPFQSAQALVELRNGLVHFKPEWDDQLDKHAGIESLLRGRVTESAFSSSDQVFFPHRCLGGGCAAWSVKAARTFVSEFFQRINLPDAYGPYDSELNLPT